MQTSVFSAGQAAVITENTYRCLDDWAEKGVVVPSIQPAAGHGSARAYSFSDLVSLRAVGILRQSRVALRVIASVVKSLRSASERALVEDNRATVLVVSVDGDLHEVEVPEFAKLMDERGLLVAHVVSVHAITHDVLAAVTEEQFARLARPRGRPKSTETKQHRERGSGRRGAG